MGTCISLKSMAGKLFREAAHAPSVQMTNFSQPLSGVTQVSSRPDMAVNYTTHRRSALAFRRRSHRGLGLHWPMMARREDDRRMVGMHRPSASRLRPRADRRTSPAEGSRWYSSGTMSRARSLNRPSPRGAADPRSTPGGNSSRSGSVNPQCSRRPANTRNASGAALRSSEIAGSCMAFDSVTWCFQPCRRGGKRQGETMKAQ